MPRDPHSVHQTAETPTFGGNLRAIQNEGIAEIAADYAAITGKGKAAWRFSAAAGVTMRVGLFEMTGES